jgi:hypothetical protein
MLLVIFFGQSAVISSIQSITFAFTVGHFLWLAEP